jgi:hypothetical protein
MAVVMIVSSRERFLSGVKAPSPARQGGGRPP